MKNGRAMLALQKINIKQKYEVVFDEKLVKN